MKNTLQIISSHSTLSEAVKVSGMDLSYNEALAKAKIADIQCGFQGWKSGEAFITDEGVFFILKGDITILNKFDPFMACISDSPFQIVDIQEAEIFILEGAIPKNPQNRKKIASMGLTVTCR